jgi:glycyl-tRNA synthetase beta chain
LFKAGEKPTGSRDPFGMRRAAQGAMRILVDVEKLTGVRARVSLGQLFDAGAEVFGITGADRTSLWAEAMPFLSERLVFVLESRGFDGRNVRAVLATLTTDGSRSVLDVVENLKVLPEFAASEQFRQLATAFKRVRNIAKELKTVPAEQAAGLPKLADVLKEPAEKALLDEIDKRSGVIQQAARTGAGYREAYVAAAGFEPVVARFFKEVMVMADDPGVRQARLRLMNELAALILQLGDISEIVATES